MHLIHLSSHLIAQSTGSLLKQSTTELLERLETAQCQNQEVTGKQRIWNRLFFREKRRRNIASRGQKLCCLSKSLPCEAK